MNLSGIILDRPFVGVTSPDQRSTLIDLLVQHPELRDLVSEPTVERTEYSVQLPDGSLADKYELLVAATPEDQFWTSDMAAAEDLLANLSAAARALGVLDYPARVVKRVLHVSYGDVSPVAPGGR